MQPPPHKTQPSHNPPNHNPPPPPKPHPTFAEALSKLRGKAPMYHSLDLFTPSPPPPSFISQVTPIHHDPIYIHPDTDSDHSDGVSDIDDAASSASDHYADISAVHDIFMAGTVPATSTTPQGSTTSTGDPPPASSSTNAPPPEPSKGPSLGPSTSRPSSVLTFFSSSSWCCSC